MKTNIIKSISGYRYAPESAKITTIYGKLSDEILRDTNIQTLAMCRNYKELEKQVKIIVRKELKKEKYNGITYAFFQENSTQFYYTKQLIADKNNIKDRLRVYKEWKNYIINNNYKLNPFNQHTVKLDGAGRIIEKEENFIKIDIKKCHTIKFKRESIFA